MTDTPDMITREEADARVAAALREAAETVNGSCWECGALDAKAILALIPDAGAAFDRALAKATADLRAELSFANAKLDAWESMAPPPDPNALRKQLEARARAKGER